MPRYKTIGILGGMGPEATAYLYLRVIQLFQQEYGAVYDSDFPEINIINLPIPDVVENLNEQGRVKRMLIGAVKKLEAYGVDFIAIPCNTVTHYINDMQAAVSISIINIVEETANEVLKSRVKRVGLLGTEATIKSRIYADLLCGVRIFTLGQAEQAVTTKIIMDLLAGKKSVEDKERLEEYIQKLKSLGAEKIILGCTELPLLLKGNADVFDTLEILAKTTVERAAGVKVLKER